MGNLESFVLVALDERMFITYLKLFCSERKYKVTCIFSYKYINSFVCVSFNILTIHSLNNVSQKLRKCVEREEKIPFPLLRIQKSMLLLNNQTCIRNPHLEETETTQTDSLSIFFPAYSLMYLVADKSSQGI